LQGSISSGSICLLPESFFRASDPAAVLRRVAALRYGGIGEAGAISRAMERCAALLKRSRDQRGLVAPPRAG